jgi:hypothetical protein
MASFSRRVFLVALLVAAVAVVFASAACDENCENCVWGVCTACKTGYYYGADGCTACKSAHCAHCQAVGWCIACEPGYRLQYVSNPDNMTVEKYGKCVNAASFGNAYTALVAAAAALLYAVVA